MSARKIVQGDKIRVAAGVCPTLSVCPLCPSLSEFVQLCRTLSDKVGQSMTKLDKVLKNTIFRIQMIKICAKNDFKIYF